MTARTPSRRGPFAAQSRDEPEPYSLPAMMTSAVFVVLYFSDASKIDMVSPEGMYFVTPPSEPGTILLRSRTFANVPRPIPSWLPRREPYELNSAGCTPCFIRYSPAGPFFL